MSNERVRRRAYARADAREGDHRGMRGIKQRNAGIRGKNVGAVERVRRPEHDEVTSKAEGEAVHNPRCVDPCPNKLGWEDGDAARRIAMWGASEVESRARKRRFMNTSDPNRNAGCRKT